MTPRGEPDGLAIGYLEEQLEVLRLYAASLIRDVEILAPAFHFVIPASASQVKALLAGKSPHDWRDMRDPDKPNEVY